MFLKFMQGLKRGAESNGRTQLSGAGTRVATTKDWRVQGTEVAANQQELQRQRPGADGVMVNPNRAAGSMSQGYVHGLPKGSDPTGTPIRLFKMPGGQEVLCRVDYDGQGNQILTPVAADGGAGSDPVAGERYAMIDPDTGQEVVCRKLLGPDGRYYTVQLGYRIVTLQNGQLDIVPE
jgi:hypothetical protein